MNSQFKMFRQRFSPPTSHLPPHISYALVLHVYSFFSVYDSNEERETQFKAQV